MVHLFKYIGGPLKPKEPTVLFIPGGLTSPAVFDGLGIFLPCQSAAIDWLMSDAPWELDIIGRRILDFVKEYDLGPTILCGYSAGGIIAMSAAIADQEGLVQGLLLSNTGANTLGHSDPDLPKNIQKSWPDHDLIDRFIKRCFARKCPEALYSILYEYAFRVPKEAAYACTASVRTIDLEPCLKDIQCPVLLAHGKDDQVRRQCHVDVLKNGIPNIELCYLDGGHTVMVEAHTQYLEKLLYFVSKIFTPKEK